MKNVRMICSLWGTFMLVGRSKLYPLSHQLSHSISGNGTFQKFHELKSSCKRYWEIRDTIEGSKTNQGQLQRMFYLFFCITLNEERNILLTCSINEVGGNMSLTRVCNDVYDLTSIQWLLATSPCQFRLRFLESRYGNLKTGFGSFFSSLFFS